MLAIAEIVRFKHITGIIKTGFINKILIQLPQFMPKFILRSTKIQHTTIQF